MTPRTMCLAAVAATLSLPAVAADIAVEDPYFRYSGPLARAGAAFMTLVNSGAADDRLVAVRADIAARVELHTHIATDDGVMQMREVEDGFPIPAGGTHALARGGDHVMFMGLTERPPQGATVALTLVFERAGEIALEIPVDLERQPDADEMQMRMQGQSD